jgi:phospholipid N-methyltransferase
MRLRERKLFCAEWLRQKPSVGAVTPSSRHLAQAVTAELDNCNGAYRILEAGAGTGAVTREILKSMRDEDSLDVFELNARFAEHLRREVLGNGHRGKVRLFTEDVLNLPARREYDHVICGIPLNNMQPGAVRTIFETFFDHLGEGGRISFYEYILCRPVQMVFGGASGRQRARAVGRTIRDILRRCEYRRVPVLRNLPPATAHHLRVRP